MAIIIKKDGTVEPFNLKLLRQTKWNLMAPTRDRTEEADEYDGEIDFGAEFQSQSLELHCITEEGLSIEEKHQKKVEIADTLNNLRDGDWLMVEHVPDKKIFAHFAGRVQIEEYPSWLRVTIPLRLDPFWVSAEENEFTGNSGTIENAGTFETPVIVEILAESGNVENPSITIGEEEIKYNGTIDKEGLLKIDAEKMTAALDGRFSLNYAESGEDFATGELDGVVAGEDGLELEIRQNILIDDFEDGDYTNDPTWTIQTGTGSIIDKSGNNKFRLTRDPTAALAITPFNISNDNFTLQIKVTLRNANTSDAAVGFTDSTGRNGYFFCARCPSGWAVGAKWYIAKMVDGAGNTLASMDISEDINENEWKLVWNGNVLEFWRNGVKLLTAIDNTFSSFTHIQLRGDGSSTSPFDWVQFDDVKVVDARCELSGSRISPPLDLSGVGTAKTSEISWNATTPTGTSVKVETSLSTDGVTYGTWQQATNGQAIPGITANMDLSTAKLKTRATLATTDTSVTPLLTYLRAKTTSANIWESVNALANYEGSFPKLPPGETDVSVTAESGDPAVTFKWHDRWI